jgi:hypothetical protein
MTYRIYNVLYVGFYKGNVSAAREMETYIWFSIREINGFIKI